MPPRSKQQSLPGLEDDGQAARGKGSATKSKSPKGRKSAGSPATKPVTNSEPPSDGDEPCDRLPQHVDIKGWNVYVVDAYSLIFQVFHALPEMSSPSGEQVGAVFGFTRDMLYLIEGKKPNALICAFDPPGPTFRDALFDAYKG